MEEIQNCGCIETLGYANVLGFLGFETVGADSNTTLTYVVGVGVVGYGGALGWTLADTSLG